MFNTYIYSMSAKEIEKEKPDVRELTLTNGISYPSDEELIMLILGRGTKNSPISHLAGKVLEKIDDVQPEEMISRLLEIDGMGTSKALAVAAALELGRRKHSHLRAVLNKPVDVIPYVKHYSLKKTERFIVVTVNGAHEILNIRVISMGTANRTIIHPREVFAAAIAEHASGIICCHNHPYGPCYPSEPDKRATMVLKEAASILGIALLDHIIINRDDYFSFLENEML